MTLDLSLYNRQSLLRYTKKFIDKQTKSCLLTILPSCKTHEVYVLIWCMYVGQSQEGYLIFNSYIHFFVILGILLMSLTLGWRTKRSSEILLPTDWG